MFQLKPLSRDAIQPALTKAERYRFLNEPAEAESICRDVLDVDPDHQQALIVLLLALTDQFGEHASGAAQEADDILRRLTNDYERAYYSGIVRERRAKALLDRGGPGAASSVYRVAARSDGLVRAGGGASTGRERRRHPALEYLRAYPHETSAARTGGRRTSGTAVPGIGLPLNP